MDAWLAEPSVMEALHVKANTPGNLCACKDISTDSALYIDVHSIIQVCSGSVFKLQFRCYTTLAHNSNYSHQACNTTRRPLTCDHCTRS